VTVGHVAAVGAQSAVGASGAASVVPLMGGATEPTTRWPNLFIVGAAKAGTTSLWWYLAQHPDVFMTPMKEPHYFSHIHPSRRLAMFYDHIEDERAYLHLFAGAGDAPVVGEASTSYLWDPGSAERIHAAVPDARIVIVLRDPVERAWSHYWNDVAEGFETRPFLKAVRQELADPPGRWGDTSVYVSAGFYADAVERYLRLFGPDKVKVLFFQSFTADPRGTLADLFSWLGVDPGVAASAELEPRNSFKKPRNGLTEQLLRSFQLRRRMWGVVPLRFHQPLRNLLVKSGTKPKMDPPTMKMLSAIYADDQRRLEDLLGQTTGW
jgi:Sulfotransferase family